MSVVRFPVRAAESAEWRPQELRELIRLQAAGAGGWEVGATEANDPQFYLLGPAPAHDCLVCVSRLGRIYVAEDGAGRLLGEDERLSALVDRAEAALRARKRSFSARLFIALCAVRLVIEEKIGAGLEEGSEVVLRLAPQFASLA